METFIQQLEEHDQNLQQALKAQKRDDLHRLVAELAGIAGLLGAYGIREISGKTAALLADSDQSLDCVNDVRDLIHSTLEALRTCHIQ